MTSPRKSRTPQRRVPRRRPTTAALPGAGGNTLRGSQAVTAAILAQAPPDALVELLLPNMWALIAEGAPANICVDSCLTLQHAYGQFGIRSELVLVDLAIRKADGSGVLHGTPDPHWREDGKTFNGHCMLHLVDSGRFVDATVEQFEEVRAQGGGPLVGRMVASTHELQPGQVLPPGTTSGVQRGDILMAYTVSGADTAELIDRQPWVAAHASQHHRAGVNLASLALNTLRAREVIGRARQAPYPRLRAILRALGDAPGEADADRDVRFTLPGPDGEQRLRLDEIPLPPTTPAPYPRTWPPAPACT